MKHINSIFKTVAIKKTWPIKNKLVNRTLSAGLIWGLVYSCSPFKDEPFLVSNSFIKNSDHTKDIIGNKNSYKSNLPIHLTKETKKVLSFYGYNYLKRSFDSQWINADVLSETSFESFQDKNGGKLSLYQVDMKLVSQDERRFSIYQAVDEFGVLKVPASKNKIKMNVYTFKVNVKWHFEIDGSRKLYITPLKDELVLAEFVSLSNESFSANDMAEYLINYSGVYSRKKWKSNLLASLASKKTSGSQIAVLSGEGSLSSHEDTRTVSKAINAQVFSSVCKLFYFESQNLDKLASCNFEDENEDLFDDLASLEGEDTKSSFLSMVERDLRKLKISACSPSKEVSENPHQDKQFFDVYVKVKLKDEHARPLLSKGRKINLYQRKGSKRAYRVTKKDAVIDGFVENSFCGLESGDTKCLKAKYWVHKTKSSNIKKCNRMLSGKFFFSLKKDNSIVI